MSPGGIRVETERFIARLRAGDRTDHAVRGKDVEASAPITVPDHGREKRSCTTNPRT